MTRPGVVVTSRAEPPPRSSPTEAGMAFFVGTTSAAGPNVLAVNTLSQYEADYGVRAGAGVDMHDAVEAFFREGGTRATIVRAASADDAGVTAALGNLTKSFGPGQVLAPGALGQTAETQAALLEHAAANNRIALLDSASDDDAATLETLADSLNGDVETARYGALFAPGAVVPVPGGSGSTRTIAYSAIEAGIISRNDSIMSPNVAAAGPNGLARFATDLAVSFTDAERETLNDAGVNVARLTFNGVETYGYRTLAPMASGWGQLSNARLNMEIVAKAEAIGERYVFAQIDGRRVKIGQFGADLAGMLVPYYEAGSLFGDSADDAFYVDVGPQVNTLETIAAGELHAVLALRMSPFAEYVLIEIVKAATETPLSVAPASAAA